MKKFGEIYKSKLIEAETRTETKILEEFKLIYNAMLEHYNLRSIHQLNEKEQLSFLTEFNYYWKEDTGLNEKGNEFLNKRSMILNENSTIIQRKNFLKTKSYAVINETLRQSNLKYNLYDIIDEMYKQLNAKNINEVLSPDSIVNIISKSLNESLIEFTKRIYMELSDSAKSKK